MQCCAAYFEYSHEVISLNVTKGQILIIQEMLWTAADTEPKGLQPLDLISTHAVPALEDPKNLPPADFTSCSLLKCISSLLQKQHDFRCCCSFISEWNHARFTDEQPNICLCTCKVMQQVLPAPEAPRELTALETASYLSLDLSVLSP